MRQSTPSSPGKKDKLMKFLPFSRKRKRVEQELRLSLSLLQATLDSTADGVLVVDTNGKISAFNRKFLEMWRIPEPLAATKDDATLLDYVLNQLKEPELFLAKVKALYSQPEATSYDILEFKDGRIFDRYSQPQRIGDDIIGRVWNFRDVTAQRQAERSLRESEEKYRAILENIQEGYYEVDLAGNFIFFNDSLGKMLAYSRSELLGMNNRQYMVEESAKKMFEIFNDVFTTGGPVKAVEVQIQRKDGVIKFGEISVSLIKDANNQAIGFRGIVHDITERKKTEEALQASLREKEVLLKEIHHRVKNNMQVMSSLLNLQSHHIKNKNVTRMFKECQHRIRSMALVHEKLYQSADFSRIEFSEYLRSLVIHLFHSYKVDSQLIQLTLDTEEAYLNINAAIPCGLIVNELVSNSLKHAFPRGRKGEVAIELRRLDDGHFLLGVKDNGIGFPYNLDYRQTKTLGMEIVTTLAEQIAGEIDLVRNNGTEFRITFQELKNRG